MSSSAPDASCTSTRRNGKAPVFVLGCPRSGTTLLYHMLLSSGGFAVYRTESHVFSLLAPKYRNLGRRRTKEKLLAEWLKSKKFRLSGLDPEVIRTKVLQECDNAGAFLRIVMESIADQQSVERWADCTPAHLLSIRDIRRTIPTAKVIHIIRDGRDTAVSLEKLGWIKPLPWDEAQGALVAGLYWEWMVRAGRRYGREMGTDYIELRFEDLVATPRDALARVGKFIEHDLDYDRILAVGIGSVSKPNTSFADSAGSFNPIGRWARAIPPDQARDLEYLLRGSLEELNYSVEDHKPSMSRASMARLETMRAVYQALWSSKQWLKANTPLSTRLVDTSLLHE